MKIIIAISVAIATAVVLTHCGGQSLTAADGTREANRVLTLQRCDDKAVATKNACQADGGASGYCGGEGYAAYLFCKSDAGL